ncbi:hypothetical protein [Nocardia sp. CNY236]|uniref:hypothetical protein n=1 Tax=Nocardia sp. CNY236 TaxID=1169152 RepID=UPI0003F8A1C8|nr:hypothetical protein [Nocardia sp. CNY236]
MTQWLPLLGSFVVGVVALIGILINNRTNRAAVDAADERNRVTLDAARHTTELALAATQRHEHEQWRRESVLAAVSAVLAISGTVRQQLLHCERWHADEVDHIAEEIRRTITRSQDSISSLRVVSHRKIPNRCEDLMRTLTAALNITVQRRGIELDGEATVEEITDIQALWARAIENTVEEERTVVTAARAELDIKITQELQRSTAQPAPSHATAVT